MFSLLLLSSLALANDSKVDYVNVKKGAHAPFSGILIKKESLAKIIADHEEKVAKDKVECEYQIKRNTLNLDLKYDVLKATYDADVKMYKNMIQNRDDILKKESTKKTLTVWTNYGSFVLGAASAIAIFYSVK